MPRDSQRQRVYDFDKDVQQRVDGAEMSLDECKRLAQHIFRMERALYLPDVTDGRRRKRGAGNTRVIKLPRWTRTKTYVLHEVAHGVTMWRAWRALDRAGLPGIDMNMPTHHGPEYMAVYTELLYRFTPLSHRELRAIANAHRVKIGRRNWDGKNR